jgi:hypothetical protein
MPEIFTFYSQTCDSLPEPQMRLLAEGADFSVGQTDEGGRSFVIRWPDLTITCNEMTPQKVPEHLDGFCRYVRRILGEEPGERGEQILERIRHTQCVVGVIVEPERDEEGVAENLLGAMAHGLDALMFHGVALYDKDARLILAPDGSFDEEADVLGPVAAMIETACRSNCRSRRSDTRRRRTRRPDTPASWKNCAAVACRRCRTPFTSMTMTRSPCASPPRWPVVCSCWLP